MNGERQLFQQSLVPQILIRPSWRNGLGWGAVLVEQYTRPLAQQVGLDFPGLMTHREVGLLVEAGLSPMDAIVAATKNGGLALRKGDELGTIEPGRRADLLLLSANPLEDVGNLRKIDRLMVDGEWVDRTALKLK